MLAESRNQNEQIFSLLFDKDEITWQSMIYDLVSAEHMDPWDVDVSLLSQKFLEKLKAIRSMDLKVSGKVLLAAAILLRVKSTRFMEEDISALDALIASAQNVEEDTFEDFMEFEHPETYNEHSEQPRIVPRTPQPRKRKVSVFDLVNALEKALQVFKRRPPKLKSIEPKVTAPEKKRDITLVIRDVHKKVQEHYQNQKQRLTFSMLLSDDSKEEKVFTLLPLLHLENAREVNLLQEHHFGDIDVLLINN